MHLEYQYQNQPNEKQEPVKCDARSIKWYIKNKYARKLGYTQHDAYQTLASRLATRTTYIYKYIALIAKRISEICRENKIEMINPEIAEKMIDALITRIALAKRSHRK